MPKQARSEALAVRVHCSGRMHRIVLTPSGALTFPDHPDGFMVERVALALSGQSCRCHDILQAWRQGSNQTAVMPQALAKVREEAAVYGARRHYRRVGGQADPLLRGLQTRNVSRIVDIANKELQKCSYRDVTKLKAIWRTVHMHDRDQMTSRVADKGYLSVNFVWYKEVYRRGLSVIDGMFVLDARGALTDGSIPVTVAEPFGVTAGSTQIVPVARLAVPDEQGRYSLDRPDSDKNDKNAPIVVRVRCGSGMHRVVLMPSGALSFPDHPRILTKHLNFYASFSRCAEILKAWRTGNQGAMPSTLKTAWHASRAVALQRVRKEHVMLDHGIWGNSDRLKNFLSTRLELHILAVARKALAECKYGNTSLVPKSPSLLAETKARLGHDPGSGPATVCFVDRQWYTTVYCRGLAVLDGKFILEAGEADHSGVIPVTVVRRDPIVEFTAVPALAVPNQGEGEARFRLVLNKAWMPNS